ncbi:MAG: hypothetical protein ACHQUB_01235 [Candidatus Saccharimonadia bacterium]
MNYRQFLVAFMSLLIAGCLLGQFNYAEAANTVNNQPSITQSTDISSNSATSNSNIASQLPTSTNNSLNIKSTCPSGIGPLTWIACPIINTLTDAVSKMGGLIVDLLQVRPLVQDNSIYQAWSAFRDLADVAFVLLFMVLIFSTLTSISGSSYQLKSMLPKLIVAVILVQLSFFISAWAVDIGNILGAGISGIFNGLAGSMPGQNGSSLASVQSIFVITASSFGAIITGFILGLPVILLMLLGLVIGVAGVFISLAARQLIIAILIIASPLAFAAWVLPNTESMFKLWYKNLVRMILLYPIIVTILSIGGIVAKAAQGVSTGGNTNGVASQVDIVLASMVPLIAFYMIPATFKWAGSIYNTVSGRISDRTRSARNRLRNSQLRKDAVATQRERGFIGTRDIRGNSFGKRLQRGIARGQAGQYWFGTPTKRRLVRGYDDAVSAQMKDWGSLFDDQGMGNDALMKEVFLRKDGSQFSYEDPSGKRKTVTINKAMRAQALAQIVKQGGNLEVSRIYNKLFDTSADNYRGGFRDLTTATDPANLSGLPKSEIQDTWYRGLGASGMMGQVIQAVPPVNPGKLNSVFDTLSAAQVASMHGSASPFFFTRLMGDVPPSENEVNLGKTVDSLRQERVSKLADSFTQIAKSRDLSSKIDQNTVKRFRDGLVRGMRDISPLTGQIEDMYDERYEQLMREKQVNYDGHVMSAYDFFMTYVSPEGKINPEGIAGAGRVDLVEDED